MKFADAHALPAALLCSAVLTGASIPLMAAEWTNSAGVTPSITFSDNICLENENQKSEMIGTFTPSASVRGVGARANIDLTGSLNFNSLSQRKSCGTGVNGGTADSPTPRFRASAGTELIRNRFFVDVYSSASQNKTDPFAAGGDDELNRTGNVNTTYIYGIRPYYTSTLFSYADVSLSYSLDEQRNSEADLDDSTRESATLNIGNRPGIGGFSWSVTGNYSDIEYDRDVEFQIDNELSSAYFTLGYGINRKWQINGTLGKEWNSFVSSNPDDDIDGNSWDAGLVWTPNERTRLDVGTGNRFFGSTPRLDFSYTHRRSVFTANYLKQLTYSRNLRADDDIFSDTDAFGNPVDPLDEEVLIGLGTPTSTSRSPILNERFNLAWTFQGRLSTLAVTGNRSKQKRAEDDFEDTFTTAAVSFSRQLSRNFSPSLSLSWQEREADANRGVTGRDSETWRINFGFSRRIGDWTNMSLNYNYTKRESEFKVDEYTENRVTLSFSLQL